MERDTRREIPYNYTSADDESIVSLLLGDDVWGEIEALREQRRTGRSARHLMRLLGELFVYYRNPFLYHELVTSPRRQRRFFNRGARGLSIIKQRSHENPQVQKVLSACEGYLQQLRRTLKEDARLRRELSASCSRALGESSVSFAPFELISHSTDATDWRLFTPFAVVRPGSARDVVEVIKLCRKLKLPIIPRGGGTGLTGGAVPLAPRCVMVNTEKLNRIHGISSQSFTVPGAGSAVEAKVIRLDAGVITETAMAYAREHGLVFATDPTSSWASTIGGNLAENAGGKSAVRWGTAIDNVLSFRIAFSDGSLREVRRVQHPLRKILPDDEVRFEVRNLETDERREILLRGSEIRKPGLWKDITNKTLGGVPGLQKEGTDGVIVDAEFVLYTEDPVKRTLCLEFFGESMDEAAVVISKISDAFPGGERPALQAMEHFDNLYARAIGYRVKSHRNESPKAVLLVDIQGQSEEQVNQGLRRVEQILAEHENTDLHMAIDAAEAEAFWQDRRRLGAIARRTNAFKLNEDIVIPIASLAEFVTFCDELNSREGRHNARRCIEEMKRVIAVRWEQKDERGVPSDDKKSFGLSWCDAAIERLEEESDPGRAVDVVQRELEDVFSGYEELLEAMRRAVEQERSRVIVVATHMHAGDGNVHVNVPVFSNDRRMMQRADGVVDEVMERVKHLGGVVSGEHGIGITKLKYLEASRIDELTAYRQTVDPEGLFNPRKLQDRDLLDRVFTPSFNLLGLEAKILHYVRLGSLATRIASCVRCGKCKQPCCVFCPEEDLFYHPRNKNLAIAALIEALLYDAQRERTASFELLRHLEEIADHCTVCHRCLKPCPVGIDTGEVSVLEREILVRRKVKRTPLATRLSLSYLRSTSRLFNRLFRLFVLSMGTAVQRTLVRLVRPSKRRRALPRGKPALRLLQSPMTAPSPRTLRDILPACRGDQVVLLTPTGAPRFTTFYFPGCGSERLFADISMAAVYLLLSSGVQVIVPPPFLCCGFPLGVNAKTEEHEKVRLRNSIVLSQIREMFNYLRIDSCLVSCGTCREALQQLEIEKTFNAPLADAARFLARSGLAPALEGSFLYHAPCHDSLNGEGVECLAQLGANAVPTPFCCSEAGTMALSRPDITSAMGRRKREVIEEAMTNGTRTILTNCPSCIQGLSRQELDGLRPRHILLQLALTKGGAPWRDELKALTATANVITF
jgi:FAD/FMN-containing dehydrogenase/Fe-S oxidoreductase